MSCSVWAKFQRPRVESGPPLGLALLVLSTVLPALAESACTNCESTVNSFCCRTAWRGMW